MKFEIIDPWGLAAPGPNCVSGGTVEDALQSILDYVKKTHDNMVSDVRIESDKFGIVANVHNVRIHWKSKYLKKSPNCSNCGNNRCVGHEIGHEMPYNFLLVQY